MYSSRPATNQCVYQTNALTKNDDRSIHRVYRETHRTMSTQSNAPIETYSEPNQPIYWRYDKPDQRIHRHMRQIKPVHPPRDIIDQTNVFIETYSEPTQPIYWKHDKPDQHIHRGPCQIKLTRPQGDIIGQADASVEACAKSNRCIREETS
jgi:hypothetical protein